MTQGCFPPLLHVPLPLIALLQPSWLVFLFLRVLGPHVCVLQGHILPHFISLSFHILPELSRTLSGLSSSCLGAQQLVKLGRKWRASCVLNLLLEGPVVSNSVLN